MSDHLEHLAECEVCSQADYQVEMTAFLDWETDMLEQRPQDVGIFDPQLVRLWDNEHQVRDITNAVMHENQKYYNGGIDIPVPPRPDEDAE